MIGGSVSKWSMVGWWVGWWSVGCWSVDLMRPAKNYYSCNPSTCIYENRRYLKSIVDNSVIVCSLLNSAVNVKNNM